MVTSKQQESAKKKSLNRISGSNWISAGLSKEVLEKCKYREMNVNISNEFNFSVVHGAMNRSGSLAKLT